MRNFNYFNFYELLKTYEEKSFIYSFYILRYLKEKGLMNSENLVFVDSLLVKKEGNDIGVYYYFNDKFYEVDKNDNIYFVNYISDYNY